MRILEIVISLEKGGRTKRILQLCRDLAARGHRVTVLVLHMPPPWVQQEYLQDIDWQCLEWRDGIDLRAFWRLWRLLRAESFDILHAHCETSILYIGVFGRLLRLPVVATYHRSLLSAYTPGWRLRFIANLPRVMVAVSTQRAQLLRDNLRVPAEKIQIIHGAIDMREFPAVIDRAAERRALNLPATDIIWFSAGHLGEIKGHDDSLRALALVKDELPVRLFIAGDGQPDEYQRLQQLATELGIADRVVLLGQINTIPQWLIACDIFLQPSLEEAFGLVFVEAGAAQRPVVATEVGGIPDIVVNGETGLLVAPHAPVELAASLLLLSKSRQLAEQMGMAARARVLQHFTLEHMLERYDALFAGLLADY